MQFTTKFVSWSAIRSINLDNEHPSKEVATNKDAKSDCDVQDSENQE